MTASDRCSPPARQDADLSQRDLAALLGKPQSYVSKYERGERRLDMVEFLDVADALGLDPQPFLLQIRGEEEKETRRNSDAI